MARGRMLNKSVGASKKFQALPDDTCRLLASWTISHLDKRGVFHADPAMVRSYVFPRRTDVTEEQIIEYLAAMQEAGLIVVFITNGDAWQYWPGFTHNQIGLRDDRETTTYPPPPDTSEAIDLEPSGNLPASIPQVSRDLPAEEKLIQEKLSTTEEKLREQQQESDVVVSNLTAKLISLGIQEILAQDYAADDGLRDMVLAQIASYEYAHSQGTADGPGWLIKAIEGEWAVPQCVLDRLQQQDRTRYTSGEFADVIQS